MQAVVDSSSLISLARSGLLTILDDVPIEPVLLDVVRRETVDEGLAAGYADAAAIESTWSGRDLQETAPGDRTVDAVVLAAASGCGILVANDQALGRRAKNLGIRWLRSADLVMLAHRSGAMSSGAAKAAVGALCDSGRITAELAESYLEEL